MKDNYTEMNVDMEQILFSKEYDELTVSEKEEIKDFISSKEDFYLMKNTLVSVKNSFGIEEEIEPDVNAKEKLMKMFNDKNGKVVPLHRPFYLSPVFQIGVAAAVILGIIFFYPDAEKENRTAMNEVEAEDGDAGNKTSLKDTEMKEEAPAEESVTETMLSEEESNKNESAESVAGNFREPVEKASDDQLKDKTVSGKTDVATKAEGYFSSTSRDTALAERSLYTRVERKSVTKEAEETEKKKVASVDEVADVDVAAAGGVTNATSATGFSLRTATVPASDATVTVTDGTKGKEKDSDGKYGRTNSAGGHYYQPAKPDVKTGVSLKDEPALAEFLFTAL